MYENINTFGRFVREKRLDAGDVTLKDIGYAVGVSLSYYSDIEHDRRNPGEGFDYEALAKLLRLTESENGLSRFPPTGYPFLPLALPH